VTVAVLMREPRRRYSRRAAERQPTVFQSTRVRLFNCSRKAGAVFATLARDSYSPNAPGNVYRSGIKRTSLVHRIPDIALGSPIAIQESRLE
jgi:hypothetical protein